MIALGSDKEGKMNIFKCHEADIIIKHLKMDYFEEFIKVIETHLHTITQKFTPHFKEFKIS